MGGLVKYALHIQLQKNLRLSGFHTIEIDGHDFEALASAFDEAKQIKGKPTAIIAKTIKGKGVSFMSDNVAWHGAAPNGDQYKTAVTDIEKILADLE